MPSSFGLKAVLIKDKSDAADDDDGDDGNGGGGGGKETSTPSRLRKLLQSISFNERVQQLTGGSPAKKKSTVIRLSYKTTSSCGGDDYEDGGGGGGGGECGRSKKYVVRPKVGQTVPCGGERPATGCWSRMDPSLFKLRSDTFLKYRQENKNIYSQVYLFFFFFW